MTAKDLKNALLQEAVQGKLVPQISSEGNAKDLLEEIKKEKAKLIKEGKLKKEKSLPEITDDEIPFDIPENWCWCRLGDLCEIITKGSSPSWQGINYVDNGILFITSENVGDEELLLTKKKYLESKFNEIQSRSILKRGDILTNIVGASIGRSAIFDLNIDNANINQAVCIIRLVSLDLTKFIVKILNSRFVIEQMMDNTVDTARANISLTTVGNFTIPLPPLAEQKRIVAAIEQFMPLIEEYGKKEAELTALNADIAKTLKNAILQEAVQGKLAPQIVNEGNAKDLLEEIKKEKAKLIKEGKLKKEKPLPEITEDEIPFDIPKNWCWCRLGDLCSIFGRIGFRGYTTNDLVPEGQGAITLSPSNMTDAGMNYSKCTYISWFKYEESPEIQIENDDILVVKTGSSYGKTCLVHNLTEKATINPQLVVLKFVLISKTYLSYVLCSPYAKNFFEVLVKGTSIPTYSQAAFANVLIPIPPLDEQKRIVEEIEIMLPLCEKIGE